MNTNIFLRQFQAQLFFTKFVQKDDLMSEILSEFGVHT